MTDDAKLKETLFGAGRAACEVLLRHFGRIESHDNKGEVDLVTIADRESEAAVIARIRADWPEHGILGEESAGKGDTARAASPGSGFWWVIDPLDGTMNYAHGVPLFAVSIALMEDGEARMGLVVDPVRNEWFYARRGGGAFLNDRPIRVSGIHKLGAALLATGFPHDRREHMDGLMRVLGVMLMRSHGVVRLGAAALDLVYVAAGRLEAFYEEHLSPWDVAAGNLIVEEAGGRASDYTGRRARISDRELLATNGHIHDELLGALQEVWEKW